MLEDSRYEALARSLMESHDPLKAVASELGDQAGRLDAILRRLTAVEDRLQGHIGTHKDRDEVAP